MGFLEENEIWIVFFQEGKKIRKLPRNRAKAVRVPTEEGEGERDGGGRGAWDIMGGGGRGRDGDVVC